MKLELNKTYKTKNNKIVKITSKMSWGFFGMIQDDSKILVKYTEDGKVPGWSMGNFLDIKGEDDSQEEKNKETTKR